MGTPKKKSGRRTLNFGPALFTKFELHTIIEVEPNNLPCHLTRPRYVNLQRISAMNYDSIENAKCQTVTKLPIHLPYPLACCALAFFPDSVYRLPDSEMRRLMSLSLNDFD